MPIPGNRSEIGCSKPIARRIERLLERLKDTIGRTHRLIDNLIEGLGLPEAFKIPLRLAVGVLPAVIGSLFFERLSPLFTLVAIASTFCVMRPVQARLFEFSPKEKHWSISVPVHAFFIGWAALLAAIGHAGQIARSVGGLVLVVAVAIWPVYMGRKAYQAKERPVPFKTAYILVASVVIVQQFIIGRDLL
jgi:hypothetical protein